MKKRLDGDLSKLLKRAGRHRLAQVLAPVMMALSAAAIMAVRANSPAPSDANPTTPAAVQGQVRAQSRLQSRLALQPYADRLRRRLGKRFVAPGREVSVLTGELTIGSQRNPIRIVRSQDDEGETVSIALSGQPASLSWDSQQGARSDGPSASANLRSLIERLVLDSPDQFVLAQLRGASYYTLGQSFKPSLAGGENYSGPLWTLVRVSEPAGSGLNKPLSDVRLFYINEKTGLIDKVSSQEGGEVIVADFSDWVKVGEELLPRRTSWSRNKQVVMELELNNIGHGPKQ